MKILCAVLDEGSVLPVDIAGSETVGDLKKDIVKWQKYDFAATKLDLYLARKGRDWVQGDEDLDELFQMEMKEVSAQYTNMKSYWQLDNVAYFGENFERKVGEIHVLVLVPNDASIVSVRERKRQKLELELIPSGSFPISMWFTSDLICLPSIKISMENWVSMTYNGMLSNLNFPLEGRKDVIFKYFEMDFPILMNKRMGGTRKVFVRPCYETLFDLLLIDIKTRCPSIAVTGNPGVGKSLFYAYCVLRLSKGLLSEKEELEGKTLIVNACNEYFLLENGVFRELSVLNLGPYKRNKNLIRLIDGQSTMLEGWSGVSILFTSPHRHRYHTFMNSDSVEYVMPPWTHTELSIAAPEVTKLKEGDVRKRYSQFGGNAGLVLAHYEPDFNSLLEMAMSRGKNLVKLMRSVTVEELFNDKNFCHMLVHMYPTHKFGFLYRQSILHFSSHEVAERVYRRLVSNDHKKLNKFLVVNQGDTNSASLRGKLFEIHCHHLWSSSPRSLVLEGRCLIGDQKFSILVPKTVETFTFATLKDVVASSFDTPFYCQSERNLHPFIDAVYWNMETCYLLHMSVSEKDVVRQSQWMTILKWLRSVQRLSCACVVFVAPATNCGQQGLLNSTVQETLSNEVPQCVVGIKVGVTLLAVKETLASSGISMD